MADAAEVQRLSIAAADDAYVSQQAAATTFDTLRLTAGSSAGKRQVIYLKFTVPQLPAGAVEVEANLVLTRDLHHLPNSVELSAVESSQWSEKTLTMNNAPPTGASLGRVSPTTSTDDVIFKVSSGAAAGTHSYAVTSAATNDVARFRSSEYGAKGPRLVVTYRIASTMWIGAAANDGSGIAGIDVFNESNAAIGPLRFRRSFDSGLPSSFQTSAAKDDAANGYRSFVSWKPPNGDFVGAAQGKYDPQVIAWAQSVPTTGVYATSFHEPENDMTGAQFVALQRHLYTVVKAANPSIQWGPVYMSYWWDDGTNHYIGDKAAWWPGNDYADFTAVDTYSAKQPVALENDPEFRGWYDYMLGTGEEMIISEYGQYVVKPGLSADPVKLADRARIITEDAAWLAEQGTISMWLYWDATGAQGDWRLNDPESQQAWREVAGTGRTD
ncbi:MAG: DNRLRE domain-containing protein [Geodermatophilaceae bacterium]|nr:DNRLRE domain-containing protein [Geodermatophilaceae bacterium]